MRKFILWLVVGLVIIGIASNPTVWAANAKTVFGYLGAIASGLGSFVSNLLG